VLPFQQVGKPPTMSVANRPTMALACLFVPEARETVEMMYEFEKPFIVDSDRFEKAFGLQATPLPGIIGMIADRYRKHMAGA
jgi:hypothetical protein